jgi:uncharacterized protein YuzE
MDGDFPAPWPPASHTVTIKSAAWKGVMTATLTVDFAADAAYLTLSDHKVVETCEVSTDVLVDLDDLRMVVGVEVLRCGRAAFNR